MVHRRMAIAVALLCTAPLIYGAVTTTESTLVSLYKGTTKTADYGSWDACQTAARDAAKKLTTGTATWSCKGETRKLVATITADPPATCTAPKPADLTRSQACPPGTTGSWLQTSTATAVPYPSCWSTGDFLPASAPAGACTPVVVIPPTTGADSRSGIAVLENFSNQRKANNGADLYFDVYNGNKGDAGPNQSVLGVANHALRISVPADNVLYVDADSCCYTSARDFLAGHVLSGKVTSATNRLSFLMRGSIDAPRRTDGGDTANVGTYVKSTTDLSSGAEGATGAHFYHGFDPAFYKDRWVKFVVTNKPQHQRGGANGSNYEPQPSYFQRMTRTYYTPWGYYPGNAASTWELAQFELYTEVGEADSDIASMTLTYSGKRYEVTWASSRRKSETFDVLYSLDGTAFKSFSGGQSGGTVSNTGDDYANVFWASPAVPESPNGFWIAIRKQGSTLFTSEYLNYQIGPGNTAIP